MAKRKTTRLNCKVVDYSKVKGKYKGREWNKLEQKQEDCKGKVKKFRAATGGEFTTVIGKRLIHNSKRVCREGKDNYEFVNGRFAMTSTFHGGMKEVLIPFKTPQCAKLRKREFGR